VLEPAHGLRAAIGRQGISFNRFIEYHGPSGKVNKVVEDLGLDRTYAALADPTRRALLIALRAGEARITDLAAPLPMTFAGVSRHVGVLEAAGLVRREIRGREHWLTLQPEALTLAERWIGEQTSFWARRAAALAQRLERKDGPR
jgi:DNA-binding transcriptional ArsR family regulator